MLTRQEQFVQDLKRFPNASDLVQHVQRFISYPLVMNYDKKVLTLFHGDYWLYNVMLKKTMDGTYSCYTIDWQLFSFGSPSWDIALLLVSSVTFKGDIHEKVSSMIQCMFGHMISFCGDEDTEKEVIMDLLKSLTDRTEIVEALIYAVKWVIASWDCMATLHQNAVNRYLTNVVSAMNCAISSGVMN